MILKLGMLHQGLKLYKVYINDDPGMTLVKVKFCRLCIGIGKTVTKPFNGKHLLAAND